MRPWAHFVFMAQQAERIAKILPSALPLDAAYYRQTLLDRRAAALFNELAPSLPTLQQFRNGALNSSLHQN